MTRTNNRWIRPYLSGYAVGDSVSNVGSLGWTSDTSAEAAYTDDVKNAIVGMVEVSPVTLNTILSPSASTGLYELANSGLGTFDLLVAYGILAEPKIGDPIFAWRYEQIGYSVDPGGGFVMATIDLATTYATNNPAVNSGYSSPFGVMLHAAGATVAVNSNAGIDDNGAATTAGGVFFWHLLSSDGSVTLKLQDAATNTDGSFSDLTGATSGVLAAAPASGQVALSRTATIRRYLRWQLVFGTASTASFVLGFHRGR